MTPEEARRRGYGVKLISEAPPAPVPPLLDPTVTPVEVNVTVENPGLAEALKESTTPPVPVDNTAILEAIGAIPKGKLITSCDVEHEWDRGFPILTKVNFNYE